MLSDAAASSESDLREVTVFEQGSVRETKNPLDLALVSDGFFSIQTSDGIRYTRNGNFRLDPSGFLVLEKDLVVMGENGPIEVRGEIVVNEQGEVYLNGEMVDRLRIVTFDEPYPLKKVGNSLFAIKDEQAREGDVEQVKIKQGFVEESNVNPIEEMVNMITLFRYFEADHKALRAHDEILDKAVNDIGRV
jgi:flagellar basal-body rod protein FlgG